MQIEVCITNFHSYYHIHTHAWASTHTHTQTHTHTHTHRQVVGELEIRRRSTWCNGYHFRKSIQRLEFKSLMRLYAFHLAHGKGAETNYYVPSYLSIVGQTFFKIQYGKRSMRRNKSEFRRVIIGLKIELIRLIRMHKYIYIYIYI